MIFYLHSEFFWTPFGILYIHSLWSRSYFVDPFWRPGHPSPFGSGRLIFWTPLSIRGSLLPLDVAGRFFWPLSGSRRPSPCGSGCLILDTSWHLGGPLPLDWAAWFGTPLGIPEQLSLWSDARKKFPLEFSIIPSPFGLGPLRNFPLEDSQRFKFWTPLDLLP
jgi:hypothetical protein